MKLDFKSIIKIIIADDQPLCRYGFRRMFNAIPDLKLIGEATNGEDLIKLARELKPDIIVTDIRMPGMNGIEATKRLTKEFPDISVIALTMVSEYNLITDMLEAGAKGYVSKNADADEITVAINTVYKGETYYCKDTTLQLVKVLAKRDFQTIRKNIPHDLSEREISVMKLICAGYSNKEIAKELYLSTRTIEWYKNRILEKLDSKNTAHIVAYAIKNKIC